MSVRNARVKKKQPLLEKSKLEEKEKIILALATKVASSPPAASGVGQKPFRFLDLPGGIYTSFPLPRPRGFFS